MKKLPSLLLMCLAALFLMVTAPSCGGSDDEPLPPEEEQKDEPTPVEEVIRWDHAPDEGYVDGPYKAVVYYRDRPDTVDVSIHNRASIVTSNRPYFYDIVAFEASDLPGQPLERYDTICFYITAIRSWIHTFSYNSCQYFCKVKPLNPEEDEKDFTWLRYYFDDDF